MADPAQVAQFCEATGATPAQATALLSAFGGNMEAAVETFFGAQRGRAVTQKLRGTRLRRACCGTRARHARARARTASCPAVACTLCWAPWPRTDAAAARCARRGRRGHGGRGRARAAGGARCAAPRRAAAPQPRATDAAGALTLARQAAPPPQSAAPPGAAAGGAPARPAARPAARGQGNVRSLADLGGDDDDDSDDEDRPVETFIGGAKRRARGAPARRRTFAARTRRC